jgi:PleD family two-component response regulator
LPRKAGASWFTISAGVVQASEGDDLRGVLERARGALMAAVNQGRNLVVGHDPQGSLVRESPLAAT